LRRGGWGWEDEGGAGLRGKLKGAPGILGRRAQGEAGGNRGRDRGRALREEGDESGKWGPRVSECGERHERASERAAGADVLGPGGRGGPRAGRC